MNRKHMVVIFSMLLASCSASTSQLIQTPAPTTTESQTPTLTNSKESFATPIESPEYHPGNPVENSSQALTIAKTALKNNEFKISYNEPLTVVKVARLGLAEFNQLLDQPRKQPADMGSVLYFESQDYKKAHELDKYYLGLWVIIFYDEAWRETLLPLNGTPVPPDRGCFIVAINPGGGSLNSAGGLGTNVLAACDK